MDNLKKNMILMPFNLLYKISPKLDLKILFRLKMRRKLNLKNPRTYNEKLQWIKLYDKNPLMAKCCDKYTVRKYIEKKGYGHLLTKLLWSGFRPEDIPFDDLPDKFVIKVTHGSTFNIICLNKAELDRKETVKKCKRWLREKFLPCYGEWFYGVEKPRVIVEEYLESDDGLPLFDYKFFCFNGVPRMIHLNTRREGEYAINAYDADFNLFKNVKLGYSNDTETEIKVPDALQEMKKIAADLSKDFLHVRVDLYYTHGKIYFGELTFTNGAGFVKISPYKFDEKMGDWLKLPIEQ